MDDCVYGILVDIGFCFFFVGLLCGLAICINRCLDHAESNRRPTARQIINNDEESQVISNNLIITIVPSAFNPTILQSIPIVDFNSRNFKNGIECVVCLLDLVDGDKSRILPSCNHCFHVDCIDMWLIYNSTCPICRTKIRFGNQTRSETDHYSDCSSCAGEVSIESQIPDAMEDAENPHSGGSSSCNEV